MKNSFTISNVLIIGAGKGGNALLDILISDITTKIVGVVDLNPDAIGIINAKKLGIKVSKSYKHFIDYQEEHKIDIVIDVTDSERMYDELKKYIPSEITLISDKAAKFIWALIESRKNNELLKNKYRNLKEVLNEGKTTELIYGTTPAMQEIKEMIYQVAPTPATVLILGETGTGKEMIASAIQEISHLSSKPFVKINCTAFSQNLLESELFGYKKGAFTGATKDRKGLLHKGNGGTIFLDEIGDISLDMQVKILRFIQFGEIRPVGATKTETIKARIIAATNKNLEAMVEAETFRKDLFYRLNSFMLNLPSLKNRKEDIPLLSYLFLNKSIAKLNKKVKSISSSAMACLNQYDYPGNIRELQSLIERAVILCNGETIRPEHLPMIVQSTTNAQKYELGLASARESVNNQFERKALQYYLAEANGNVSEAAKLAKTPRRSFYRLLEKHKIKKERFKNIKS